MFSHQGREITKEAIADEDLEVPPAAPIRAPGRRTLTGALAPRLFREVEPRLGEIHGVPASALELVAAAIGRAGKGLPDELRGLLEAHLGADLRGVRVHDDATAARAAAAVGARAFAVGSEIVFADGAFAPGTPDGDHLIAHEVVHAARHRGAGGISHPSDAEEAEARAEADRFVAEQARPVADEDRELARKVLGRFGVTVGAAQIDQLARHYRQMGGLTRWSLGSEHQGAVATVNRMLAHVASCHPECRHDDAELRRPLDDRTREMIERTTGQRLPEVAVVSDPDVAARGMQGEARAGEIRLAPDIPGPDDPFGLRVRLHEAAHLAQMYAPAGTPTGDVPAVEREAEAIAGAASRGEARPVAVAASPAGAYGGIDLPGGRYIPTSWDEVEQEASELAEDLNPMAWLRANFPKVAKLLDGGLDGVLSELADLVWGALKPVLDGLGIDKLMEAFTSVVSAVGDSNWFGALTGCCTCLEKALDDVLDKLDGLLTSDGGKDLQRRIGEAQKQEKDGILDLLGDFFGLLQKVGKPIMEVIDAVDSAVSKAKSVAGKLGDLVWDKIADTLGLDKSLGPIAAIKKKLQELWDKAAKVFEPITGAIKAIGAVIAAPFAPFILLFKEIPKLVAAVKKLVAIKAKDAKAWLAAAAEVLATTIFGPLLTALDAVGGAFQGAASFVAGIVKTIADKIAQLEAFKSTVAIINAIVDGITGFAAKVAKTVEKVGDSIEQALSKAWDATKKVYDAIKPLLDFVIGLMIALQLTAMGQLWALPMFVLANLFVHVLPDCYKVAIADFILKAFIALIEWYPAEGMPLLTVVRAGTLGFLRAVLAASPAEKAKAMNLVASLFAGNVEFVAGLVVGVVKGVYESTIGTIVFIFEAVGWVASVGGEAITFASTTMGKDLDEEAKEDGDAAPEAAEEPAEQPAEEPAEDPAEGAPPDADGGDKDEDGAEEDDEAEEEIAVGEGVDEDYPAPEEDEDGADGGDVVGEFEGPEDDEEPAAAEEPADKADGEPAGEPAPAPAPQGTLEIEPPPPMPDLASGRALFDAVFKQGVTREELEALLSTMNTGLEKAATAAGGEVGTAIIKALNADSAAYDIGQVVGFVVGMVVVEVAIIYFTAGAGAAKTGVTLTKLGVKGVKGLRGAMTALRGIAKAIKPVMQAFQKLKGALATWAKAVAKYIDDLIKWGERTLKKLLARMRGKKPPRKPKGPKPKKPKKPTKPKKPKKPKDRDQLRIAAMKAAQKGWSHLLGSLGAELHSKTEVKNKLKTVRVKAPRKIKVALSLASMGSGWKVKARAAKGLKAKTWKKGSGWITTKHKSTKKLYATKSYKKLHKDIIDDAIKELVKDDDKPDELDDEYKAKKKEVEKVEQAGQKRITLKGVKFTIDLEPFKGVQKDLSIKAEFVISPNATTETKELPLGSRKDLEKAKAALPKQLFTGKRLAEVLDKSHDMARRRASEWTKLSGDDKLHTWQSKKGDPLTEYTFSEKMAGKRELTDSPRNREKYGYSNPSQTSSKGITILNKGIRSDSPQPAPHDDSRYDSMSGGARKTSGPYSNFPRVLDGKTLAVLGHKYVAVMNWNYGEGGTEPGHKRTKSDNQTWNQDPDNYWGPEHREESDREGGLLKEKYFVPRESIGSDRSWWEDES